MEGFEFFSTLFFNGWHDGKEKNMILWISGESLASNRWKYITMGLINSINWREINRKSFINIFNYIFFRHGTSFNELLEETESNGAWMKRNSWEEIAIPLRFAFVFKFRFAVTSWKGEKWRKILLLTNLQFVFHFRFFMKFFTHRKQHRT